jgi:hypothetical protein
MPYPSASDYIQFLFQLLDEFSKVSAQKRGPGRPVVHTNESLIVFFSLMVLKGCTAFVRQWRWLVLHPEVAQTLRFSKIPSRRTLSRRFKGLEKVISAFIEFVGQWAVPLGEAFQSEVVYEDKSLFKAQGAVWHKKDQQANRIPKGVRNLDTDASWSKSGYHGWVFGYGLHTTVTGSGFPLLAEVKTAKVSEQTVLTQKQDVLFSRNIGYLIGDDGYTNFDRTEKWAKRGLI